jgi:hypothetical protein
MIHVGHTLAKFKILKAKLMIFCVEQNIDDAFPKLI